MNLATSTSSSSSACLIRIDTRTEFTAASICGAWWGLGLGFREETRSETSLLIRIDTRTEFTAASICGAGWGLGLGFMERTEPRSETSILDPDQDPYRGHCCFDLGGKFGILGSGFQVQELVFVVLGMQILGLGFGVEGFRGENFSKGDLYLGVKRYQNGITNGQIHLPT